MRLNKLLLKGLSFKTQVTKSFADNGFSRNSVMTFYRFSRWQPLRHNFTFGFG